MRRSVIIDCQGAATIPSLSEKLLEFAPLRYRHLVTGRRRPLLSVITQPSPNRTVICWNVRITLCSLFLRADHLL